MRRKERQTGPGRLALVPLVVVLGAPLTARAQEPRAAIEVTSDPAGTGDVARDTIPSRLAAALTDRLTEEGFHVVARDAEPDVVVSLSVGAPDCVLRATRPTVTVERRVLGCGVVVADDQLELVQKAAELARSAYRREEPVPPPGVDARPMRPAAAAVPPVSPTPPVLSAVAPSATAPATWEVSTGLDLQIRAGRLDPAARLGSRVRLDADWALHLTTGLSRATSGPAVGSSLAITEGTMLAGVARRIHDGERVRIEAAVFAGALVHHFDDGADSGTRLDPVGALALTGTVRLSRHLGVQVRLAPGMSRTEYRHVAGNVVVWQGGRPRLDAGIGVVFH